MKKKRCLFNLMVVPLLILVILTGCQKSGDPTADRVELRKDGTIKAVMTAAFDKDYYDVDELRQNLELAVEDYNTEAEGFRIEVVDAVVKDGTSSVSMYYRTDEDYAAFNHVTFEETDLDTAISDGKLDGSVNLTGTADGGIVSAADISDGETAYQLLTFNEPIEVKLPGDVCYVSDALEVTEDGYVRLKDTSFEGTVYSEDLYVVYK